ncbi:serine/threonine protein kinase [Clostridium sp. HCS.1]|uniref:serine/threonine protein kinase n=1 Tax=Clostridium sp. HCS.1 TaxID=3238594 RepID=UPI003A1015CC
MNYLLEVQELKLLGSGAEGAVYLTPEGYALKVFKDIKNAKKEDEILKQTIDSRFFPNSIVRFSNILIREYVGGVTLKEYISKHGLPYNLSKEIIDLIEDLKKLNFKRINFRNAHIFVNSNGKIQVIDPRKPYSKVTPYPKDIIKILVKYHLFDIFLKDVLKYNPSLLPYWTLAYDYLAEPRVKRIHRYG